MSSNPYKPPRAYVADASDVLYHQKLPVYIWILSCVLPLVRYLLFYFINVNQSHDALWQFEYAPIWVIDFPISIAYFMLPTPLAEEFIGPIWWIFVPTLLWKWRQYHKRNYLP